MLLPTPPAGTAAVLPAPPLVFAVSAAMTSLYELLREQHGMAVDTSRSSSSNPGAVPRASTVNKPGSVCLSDHAAHTVHGGECIHAGGGREGVKEMQRQHVKTGKTGQYQRCHHATHARANPKATLVCQDGQPPCHVHTRQQHDLQQHDNTSMTTPAEPKKKTPRDISSSTHSAQLSGRSASSVPSKLK